MKVITIKQPFASLIAEGLKEYEFRTWKTKYRGEILIHAGKGIDKKARKMLEERNPLVYSSIIKHTEWNGYGFKLENVKKIEPISVNGKLSLWDYDYR